MDSSPGKSRKTPHSLTFGVAHKGLSLSFFLVARDDCLVQECLDTKRGQGYVSSTIFIQLDLTQASQR
jgi:hypothetical protein